MKNLSFWYHDNRAITGENAESEANCSTHYRLSIALRGHVDVSLRLSRQGSNAICTVAVGNAMLPDALAIVVVTRVVAMPGGVMEHAVGRVLANGSLSVNAAIRITVEEIAVVLSIGRGSAVDVLRCAVP